MSECVLDANVLVAWIDVGDSQHARALKLMAELERQGIQPIALDVLVGEAVSALCRRFSERKRLADLPAALAPFLQALTPWKVTWVAAQAERLYENILKIVVDSGGLLNFNDAFLVLLQREERIGDVATFDRDLKDFEGFRTVQLS